MKKLIILAVCFLVYSNALTNYAFTNSKDAYISNVDCSACFMQEKNIAFGTSDSTHLDIGEIYYDQGIQWLDVGYHDAIMAWDISNMPTTATGCVGNLTLFTSSAGNCPNEDFGAPIGQLIVIYETADFNELTVTWNTAPTKGSQIALAGSMSPYQDGIRKQIVLPLGNYVQTKRAAGSTSVYFWIHTTNNAVCTFGSKEHGTSSKRPTFSVTCN